MNLHRPFICSDQLLTFCHMFYIFVCVHTKKIHTHVHISPMTHFRYLQTSWHYTLLYLNMYLLRTRAFYSSTIQLYSGSLTLIWYYCLICSLYSNFLKYSTNTRYSLCLVFKFRIQSGIIHCIWLPSLISTLPWPFTF